MVLNIVSTKFSNTQRQGRGPSPEVIEVCWDEYPMVSWEWGLVVR